MNKTEIMELAKTLGDHASPQLQSYAYTTWMCELGFIIVGLLALAIVWKYLGKLNTMLEDNFPLGWCILGTIAFLTGLALLFFIPRTLHVFTTPELEAIRMLFGSQS